MLRLPHLGGLQGARDGSYRSNKITPHPAVTLAGDHAEPGFAGREVLIKAKTKAGKVAWDDSAAEQDSIPALRGPVQAPSVITAPDFGGEAIAIGRDE